MVFDWNNISQYEKEQVQILKEAIAELSVAVPDHITDETLLKYIMSEQFDAKKAAQKFTETLNWL